HTARLAAEHLAQLACTATYSPCAKRRKLSEEAQEAEDLRKRLEVVEDEDDDVFVEATPLASKVPVVDYKIVLIDNKPRFKIIRADETHQLYISFATLLKNFDREDLESLWRIVKDRFSTSKPTNFSDEYLLLTLKTMFEELDGQDAIWRNQKSVHGLSLVKIWKLLASCGVHVITLSTVQLFLLVKRRYPLLRFTLEQLVNVTRLQVEDEIKDPYKLRPITCHLSIELEHKAYWTLKQTNFDLSVAGDHRKIQLNELNKLRDHAYENSLIYKEKTKRIHDAKIKNRVFNVGDQVLLFNSRVKIFSGKLKSRWSGPFTIANVFPYGTVELSQANGPNFKVNGHRIKHYFGGDVPQLVVSDLQTFPLAQP
nr:reverse transcriptase domain-containing protein [Tanacetum cinerariifolium]